MNCMLERGFYEHYELSIQSAVECDASAVPGIDRPKLRRDTNSYLNKISLHACFSILK